MLRRSRAQPTPGSTAAAGGCGAGMASVCPEGGGGGSGGGGGGGGGGGPGTSARVRRALRYGAGCQQPPQAPCGGLEGGQCSSNLSTHGMKHGARQRQQRARLGQRGCSIARGWEGSGLHSTTQRAAVNPALPCAHLVGACLRICPAAMLAPAKPARASSSAGRPAAPPRRPRERPPPAVQAAADRPRHHALSACIVHA